MNLTLLAACADDLSVVNAARVSFNQEAGELSEKDTGLIGFLMRERHGSPFEHGYFRFLVEAPIFVAREHMRHRIGHSYNEWSGRYSKIDTVGFKPTWIRKQIGKPGAYSYEDVDLDTRDVALLSLDHLYNNAFETYEYMLEKGVAKEVARMVLPVGTMTKYFWSCNPRSLMHFLSLRNHESAQYEIQTVAHMAENYLAQHMPVTYDAFIDNGRQAP